MESNGPRLLITNRKWKMNYTREEKKKRNRNR